MSKYMFPLPEKPPFPVFGLGSQFEGFRWLIIWNDRQNLYTVTLGHGHPESGSWVSVSTVWKTPRRQISDVFATGPAGFNHAFVEAVMRLGEIGLADDRHGQIALLESELKHAEVSAADAGTLGPQWTVDECAVDDHVRQAMTRGLNGAWATLIDMSTVSIAISGPDSMRALASPIVDVSGSLDAYV